MWLRRIGEAKVVVWLSVALLVTLVVSTIARFSSWRQRQDVAVFGSGVGQRVIVIDPGHGGIDDGAKGTGGVVEDEVVLAVAKYLQQYLKQVGGRVFLSRDKDSDLSEDITADLDARWGLADEVGADILVSIHANSFPSPYEYGSQTFYYNNHHNSKKLAQEIQGALVEGIDVLGYNYREIQTADFYILRNSSVPAVLVEVGFLSNPREEILLRQSSYQEKLAWCIFVGIVRYFHHYDTEEEIESLKRTVN